MDSTNYSTIKIDPDNKEHQRLLEEAYETIFKPIWPELANPKCETVEGFLHGLKNPTKDIKPLLLIIVNNSTKKVAGFGWGLYFPESKTAIGIYTAVIETGLGKLLYNNAVKELLKTEKDLKGFFIENIKPEHSVGKDGKHKEGVDAIKRDRYFERIGFQKIPINYIMPFKVPGEDYKYRENYNLRVLLPEKFKENVPKTGNNALQALTHSFLRSYSKYATGKTNTTHLAQALLRVVHGDFPANTR